MKKIVVIIILLLLAFIGTVEANDEKTIKDIFTGAKISYASKYVDLKNNRFNLFDEISIDYPILTGYPKVNDKLYHYCVKYLESDSFKLELLQRSKLASSIFLSRKENRSNYSLYTYNNYEKFLPVLTDVDFEMMFLFDNLLAVQIKYKYKIRNSSSSIDEDFYMQKMLFISLSDAKLYSAEKLFTPEKLASLKINLQKKGQTIFQANKKLIEEDLKSDDDDDEEEDDDSEDKEKPKKQKTEPIKKDTVFLLDELEISLTPFGVTFTIPEFSINSIFCMGVPLQLNYTVKEIQPFINAKGPLHTFITYNKEFTTTLKNCNLYRENRSDWQIPFNLQRDNNYYVTAPAKGIKTITYSIGYKAQSDSSVQKQKQREFDKDGKLVRESFFMNGSTDIGSSHVFEYNKQNLLVKITNFNKNKKNLTILFTYDANNNLTERIELDANGTKTTTRYFYDGNTAYELTEDELKNEDYKIREYHLNEYGKVISQCGFGEEAGYEFLYNKDKQLGSCNKKRPNMDNSIYCYSATGKLLTYQHDNGRHLYELMYDANDKVTEVIHIDSRQLQDIWRYVYDKNGLLINFIMQSGVYNYSNTNNLYRYKLEYEFY